MKDLSGKVAVITGGGSGIGQGMAVAFADAGMHVVVADIDEARARSVAQELGGKSIGVSVDVTQTSSVDALADRVFEQFGAVHVLCNNAGVMLTGPMLDMKASDWHWVFAVNVFGVVHGIYAFLPRMIAGGQEGHIVNTASTASFSSGAHHSVYTASKHASTAITEALRAELAGSCIGVSGLYPGGVMTDIINSQRSRQAEFGESTELKWSSASKGSSPNPLADVLQPLDVGKQVRQAIIDNEPWIFTHPHWLSRSRWDEIEAAASATMARQAKS